MSRQINEEEVKQAIEGFYSRLVRMSKKYESEGEQITSLMIWEEFKKEFGKWQK